MHRTAPSQLERGQALALVAVTFIVILLFVGLLTDVGILYASYGQLKRAVDSAAVAAATKYRVTGDRTLLQHFSRQALELNGVDNATLYLYLCDNDGNNINDNPAEFAAMGLSRPPGISAAAFDDEFDFYCPTGQTASRKYVMVYAEQDTPIYFMRFAGWESFAIRTNAISEAASLDIVLVIDSSSSMAQIPCDDPNTSDPNTDSNGRKCVTDQNSSYYDLPNTGPAYLGDFTAYGNICNLEESEGGNIDSDGNGIKACYPFYQVKNAAKTFIEKLNFPYDRVALVTFRGENRALCGSGPFIDGVGNTSDCPFSAYVVRDFTSTESDVARWVNGDRDDGAELTVSARDNTYMTAYGWDASDMSGFCNAPADYFNTSPNFDTKAEIAEAVIRYCVDSNVGGGVRVATDLFKLSGRPTAVWVMVFLTDGLTNLSDMPDANENIDETIYPNGFCQGPKLTAAGDGAVISSPEYPEGWFMTRPLCTDNRVRRRFCADANGGYDTAGNPTCPPQIYGPAAYQMTVSYDTARYNVEDYARDMVDEAALQVVCPTTRSATENCNRDANDYYNRYEPTGEEIVIYAIGLGSGVTNESRHVQDDDSNMTAAAAMLRYFAAVGDDGDRVTDPCVVSGAYLPVTTDCGNYYFAPNVFQLTRIFETIAEKIFTRLSQ